MESACENTMNANPLDLPVLGSVFTFILSISPYAWKCSLSSSIVANKNLNQKFAAGPHIQNSQKQVTSEPTVSSNSSVAELTVVIITTIKYQKLTLSTI
jgi:hypothetical protein